MFRWFRLGASLQLRGCTWFIVSVVIIALIIVILRFIGITMFRVVSGAMKLVFNGFSHGAGEQANKAKP